MPARVLVCDPGYPLETVRELLPEAVVETATAPWEGADVEGLLVGPDYPVAEDDLERLPALRAIATCSVGYDHVAVEAATRRGVWVCNVPDYCIEEMADSSLALLLALLRGVVALDRSVRDGAWDYRAAGPLPRLAGTRLGIAGFGRVGRALAERATALGLEVWATDPALAPDAIAAVGARPAALEELLAACTAFSLHVPLTSETAGLLGDAELTRMPAGSVLVNTARAQLVNDGALLRALESGRLAGAALDVLPEEPPASVPEHPRLVVTPHAAWYSPEAEAAVYRRAALAVREALAGRRPAEAVA